MAEATILDQLARLGPGHAADRPISPAEAARYCRTLARSHYENFSVASLLVPKPLRPHFYAVYAYCRWADDLADAPGDPPRSAKLLDWWEEQLVRCYQGEAEHPALVALGPTIRQFNIPIEPFADLLRAFRQDQWTTRYETPADVRGYCCYSANPVGRIVLYLGECFDETSAALSDEICTGLQLANFCQDVARDWRLGRIYLPLETCRRCGYDEAMFAAGTFNDAFRAAMQTEVDRAERCLRTGLRLVERMPRSLAAQVDLFAQGGLAVLQAIRRIDYDVWRRRPIVSKRTKLSLVARALLRRTFAGGGRR